MHQRLSINKMIKLVAFLGVWHLFLPLLVISVQKKQRQEGLKNQFSFSVLENMGVWNLLLTGCYHVNMFIERDK